LLAKIIDYQGWRNPIVVSTRSGFIVKGHARLTAAEVLELEEVPVDYQDYDSEAQEWADMLADNRIAELAEIDRTVLKDLIEELDTGAVDIELTGYTDDVIEDLMTAFHQPSEGLTDDDAVPEPTESICKKGDLWSLGNHRLLCGDATVITDVEKLMGGEKADMVFTDPPYGLGGYDGARVKFQPIAGDNGDVKQFYDCVPIDISERYVWGGFPNFVDLSSIPRDVIVWKKNNFGMGTGYRGQYELCFYWGNFKGSDSDVWEIDKDTHYKHPTQKPVALAERAITNSKPHIILDLFGGSGSTLIACEKLQRKCYMMEIDEHYCDVIIKRWEDFTGNEAVKLA